MYILKYPSRKNFFLNIFKGDFFGLLFFVYVIQHCFVWRPSDSTVSEECWVSNLILARTTRRSNHSTRYPQGKSKGGTRTGLLFTLTGYSFLPGSLTSCRWVHTL
jgi:hypothetical protein